MSTKNLIENNSGYWRAERLLQLLTEFGVNEHIDAGHEIIQRRRTVDFFVAPGTISARIQDERGHPVRVRLSLEAIADQLWPVIFNELSQSALYLAKLLCAQLPLETEQVFQRAGSFLFPTSAKELALQCECTAPNTGCKHSAALYLLASNQFVSDPFSLLTWRGRAREQAMAELRRVRQNLRASLQDSASVGSYQLLPSQPATPLSESMTHFWSSGARLQELKYTIKADELPASLLRRLDSIPVGDLQTGVELALEDAYAHVARRAQSLGLGL